MNNSIHLKAYTAKSIFLIAHLDNNSSMVAVASVCAIGMSTLRKIALFAMLVYGTFAHAQSVFQLSCQALVFVDQTNAETMKRLENFEFLIDRNTVGFNFLIRGHTHLRLAIRDRSHEELRSKRIIQQANLDSRIWTFEYAEGEGLQKDHITAQLNTLTGKFDYQRNFRGLRITANGRCNKLPQTVEET